MSRRTSVRRSLQLLLVPLVLATVGLTAATSWGQGRERKAEEIPITTPDETVPPLQPVQPSPIALSLASDSSIVGSLPTVSEPGAYSELVLAVDVEHLPADAPLTLSLVYDASVFGRPEVHSRSQRLVRMELRSPGHVAVAVDEGFRSGAPRRSAASVGSSPLFCAKGNGTAGRLRVAAIRLPVLVLGAFPEESPPVELLLQAGRANARACVATAAYSTRKLQLSGSGR